MLEVMINILSNGNHTNDNTNTMASFSLLDAGATVAVTYPWVGGVYST